MTTTIGEIFQKKSDATDYESVGFFAYKLPTLAEGPQFEGTLTLVGPQLPPSGHGMAPNTPFKLRLECGCLFEFQSFGNINASIEEIRGFLKVRDGSEPHRHH